VNFTPLQLRTIATLLVYLRRVLILSLVARLKEDTAEYERLRDRFTRTFDSLPLVVRAGYTERINNPAQRIVEREGVLAQNGRWTV